MMKQIIFGGRVMDGYFIEFKNDKVKVISTKQTGIKEMSLPMSGSSKYPGLVFTVGSDKIRADIHRVIAENLIAFPRPKCIPKSKWDSTPNLVKNHIKSLYFVNHIDHDKYNFHPTNLEWVTSKGNANAYQKHKKGITK
jgi:hypothetical protein